MMEPQQPWYKRWYNEQPDWTYKLKSPLANGQGGLIAIWLILIVAAIIAVYVVPKMPRGW